jgi:hypothetical protein
MDEPLKASGGGLSVRSEQVCDLAYFRAPTKDEEQTRSHNATMQNGYIATILPHIFLMAMLVRPIQQAEVEKDHFHDMNREELSAFVLSEFLKHFMISRSSVLPR